MTKFTQCSVTFCDSEYQWFLGLMSLPFHSHWANFLPIPLLPLIYLQCSRSVSKVQNTTQNQRKFFGVEWHWSEWLWKCETEVLWSSQSKRCWVDTIPNIRVCVSKDKCKFRRRFRDDANDTMFWIVVDANDMSAHSVQDNGEGYNKVLIQLSAED